MGAARKYPDELRDRAVRLVLDVVKDQETSVTAACRKVGAELGINADTLRGWAKQAQVDRGMRPGSTSADAARMRALERENAEASQGERDLAHGERFFRSSSTTGNPGGGLHRGLLDQFGVGPICRALRRQAWRSRRRGTTRPGRGRRRPGRSVMPRAGETDPAGL